MQVSKKPSPIQLFLSPNDTTRVSAGSQHPADYAKAYNLSGGSQILVHRLSDLKPITIDKNYDLDYSSCYGCEKKILFCSYSHRMQVNRII
jgi:hypothetical protein